VRGAQAGLRAADDRSRQGRQQHTETIAPNPDNRNRHYQKIVLVDDSQEVGTMAAPVVSDSSP
jgi:hypothetical protein